MDLCVCVFSNVDGFVFHCSVWTHCSYSTYNVISLIMSWWTQVLLSRLSLQYVKLLQLESKGEFVSNIWNYTNLVWWNSAVCAATENKHIELHIFIIITLLQIMLKHSKWAFTIIIFLLLCILGCRLQRSTQRHSEHVWTHSAVELILWLLIILLSPPLSLSRPSVSAAANMWRILSRHSLRLRCHVTVNHRER